MWIWIVNAVLNGALANDDNATGSIPKSSEVTQQRFDSNSTEYISTDVLPKSDIEVLHWRGRFHIEGFSFKGAVPGELAFGPNEQLQFSLMRPSGLPIMSLTVLENEVCVLFDLDGVQYRGSHKEFLTLTEGAVSAKSIYLIFKPDKDRKPDGWTWYSTPRVPIRALDIDTQTNDFLNAGYRGWRRKDLKRGPGRIYVHLGPNEWTLRANINKRSTTLWNASCDVDETIQVKPLSEMLEALPKQ